MENLEKLAICNIDVTVIFPSIFVHTFTCTCNQTNSYSVANLHHEIFINH